MRGGREKERGKKSEKEEGRGEGEERRRGRAIEHVLGGVTEL